MRYATIAMVPLSVFTSWAVSHWMSNRGFTDYESFVGFGVTLAITATVIIYTMDKK